MPAPPPANPALTLACPGCGRPTLIAHRKPGERFACPTCFSTLTVHGEGAAKKIGLLAAGRKAAPAKSVAAAATSTAVKSAAPGARAATPPANRLPPPPIPPAATRPSSSAPVATSSTSPAAKPPNAAPQPRAAVAPPAPPRPPARTVRTAVPAPGPAAAPARSGLWKLSAYGAVGLVAVAAVAFAFRGGPPAASNTAVAADDGDAPADGAAATPVSAAVEPTPLEQWAYEKDVQPLVRKFCIDCHGPDKQSGELALHEFKDQRSVVKGRETWEKVLERLQLGDMPPKNKPQPTDAERALLTTWLDAALNHVDCVAQVDPGRVTIRRLNREEYNRTIRDLIGVSFQPAEDFPSDDVGYGFDNIGDVLSLPPILFEKYLAAAEKITDEAIVAVDLANGPKQDFAASSIGRSGGAAPREGNSVGINSTGEIFTDFDFPRDGEYVIRGKAWGQQAGPEKCKMAFKLDGKQIHIADVAAENGNSETYSVKLQVTAGKHRVAAAFINDYYAPKAADPSQRDRNLIVDALEIQGPINPDDQQLPESHRRIVTRRPAADGSDLRECATEILTKFAARAFRRPATADEVRPLVELVQQVHADGETFERGVQIAMQAVLISPHFLFRIETDLDPGNPTAIHEITQHELATRLSYFLWSSLPDEELSGLADAGKLREPGVLEGQVRRMLSDPKSEALVTNFAGQWLQLRNLQTIAPNTDQFPAWGPELRAAMARETELFFAAVLRENRSVLDFLDGDFTFVNERLAKFYGLPNVAGDEFRRIDKLGPQRGGVLTHASVLTVTSNPTRTSPVKRGKWILENILGTPPPPPPPEVEELKDEKELTGTLRQRMEQHRANPSCATCHQRMDPLGFGFENYDAVGAWRTKDAGFDIDPSGELPSGETFQGPAGLKQILRKRQTEFTRCLAEKMLTYALGRGLEYYDKCAVDKIQKTLADDDYKFVTMIQAIVQSDPFQKRRGKGEDE